MSTLTATQLVKHYGNKVAVADISMRIDSGEIVGLLGANGAGKTTCFYMIVGLLRADAGVIAIDDREITHTPMHTRARLGIGYLPQDASVFRRLSVVDNLMAVIELNRSVARRDRRAMADRLLSEFNLSALREQRGESLSGGERRRLEIARALASQPRFMLLDEPFAGVDPISVSDIKAGISDLAERDIGVLITDHSVRETLDICDRAYIVHDGVIIAEGGTDDILRNETVRSVYLGDSFTL